MPRALGASDYVAMHEDSGPAAQQPAALRTSARTSAHSVEADRAFARKLQLMEDAQEQADYDLARRLQHDDQSRQRPSHSAAAAQHPAAFAAAGLPPLGSGQLQDEEGQSHQSPDELLAEIFLWACHGPPPCGSCRASCREAAQL